MAIYSVPNLSFIDTFINAANTRDAKTQALNDTRLQGIKELLNAGGEVYKNQLRMQAGDNEDAIAKYQWQIEKDPNTLINLRTTARNEVMNESIRKATEDATRSSELQNLWKQSNIDLEAAKYEQQAALLAYEEAKSNNDVAAMKRAELALNRSIANVNRLQNENNALSNKVKQSLGLIYNGEENVLIDEYDATSDIANAEVINALDGEIDLLTKAIATDNVSITKSQKEKNVTEWKRAIEEARKKVEESNLSTEEKNARKSLLADLELKVKNYSKEEKYNGQKTTKPKIIKDKNYYQKQLDGKNLYQLEELGLKFLEEAKNKGATHEKLDKVIKKLQKEGN